MAKYFDSLAYVKRLTAAGMDRGLAEVHAEEQIKIIESFQADDGVVKDDFVGLDNRLSQIDRDLRVEITTHELVTIPYNRTAYK